VISSFLRAVNEIALFYFERRDRCLVNNVSGQPVGLILKGQAVQE